MMNISNLRGNRPPASVYHLCVIFSTLPLLENFCASTVLWIREVNPNTPGSNVLGVVVVLELITVIVIVVV